MFAWLRWCYAVCGLILNKKSIRIIFIFFIAILCIVSRENLLLKSMKTFITGSLIAMNKCLFLHYNICFFRRWLSTIWQQKVSVSDALSKLCCLLFKWCSSLRKNIQKHHILNNNKKYSRKLRKLTTFTDERQDICNMIFCSL